MKLAIIINAYRKPLNTIRQAERLKTEFEKLSVTCDIIDNGYLFFNDIILYDAVIYLDKDKYLSLYLTKKGVKLFNNHNAIRVCDDKGETYINLESFGVKIPKTIYAPVCYDKDQAISKKEVETLIEKLSLPIIVKESYGSMGKGVYKADTKEELFALMNHLKNKPHLYQEYLGAKKGQDIRVIVIGGKVVASMLRKNNKDFRSNIALGGKGQMIELSAPFKELAEKVSKLLNLDYCGIDLLYGNDLEPVVCEVNSNAFFEEIESISNINIAKTYCQYIIDTINNK